MKIKFYLMSFFLLCSSVNAIAETQLDRYAKEQQKNDQNSLLGNKVEKKDVFSNGKVIDQNDFELPHERRCYIISTLILDNDFLDGKAVRGIKSKIAGKCIGVKGIHLLSTHIQDYFINSGYVTTRIEIPEQDLSSKTLNLRVIAGRIGHIYIMNDDVRGSVLPFSSGEILNLRDIEQGLENLQKVPGVDVKINIIPGGLNGYSNIVINTNRDKIWNIKTSYNNWGDESTGRQLTGVSGYLYNAAKLSDLFYLAATSSTTGKYKNVSAYYSFPVGFWDYEIFYSDSKSHQSIDLGYMDFDYSGINEYLSLKGTRTLYRDSDKKITGNMEILRRKSNYRLAGIKLALQERDMGNVRLGLNYKQNFDDATLNSTISWQRFLTWFGGKKTPDMLSGDVSTESQILNLNMNYMKWLSIGAIKYYYDLNFGAQYSRVPLTLQDQFTIGNRWSVRGYENSAGLDGNKGFYIQNTLNFPIDYYSAELYLGADYGEIVGKVYPENAYSGKQIIGSAIGIKGVIKSLGYDFSVSIPLMYPSGFDVDALISNFNVTYQL